ncbi:hypothetical protein Tco_0464987 [Tanacetum coccineum]
MVHQLTKFQVLRVDMVINPPWNLPFLGAKGLTSPEQTATGKGISNPFMAVMVCQKPYGVNTPGSDENSLKPYVAKGQWIAEISGLLKSLEGKLLQRYKEKNRSVADQEQLEDFYITTSQEA